MEKESFGRIEYHGLAFGDLIGPACIDDRQPAGKHRRISVRIGGRSRDELTGSRSHRQRDIKYDISIGIRRDFSEPQIPLSLAVAGWILGTKSLGFRPNDRTVIRKKRSP